MGGGGGDGGGFHGGGGGGGCSWVVASFSHRSRGSSGVSERPHPRCPQPPVEGREEIGEKM